MIDLRSDTVTRPDEGMRRAMATAEVGDDVFGDDPTVAALEEQVAALLGKESAIYVPSGTMANQIALMLHCRPGDDVYVGKDAHLGLYESGAAGALAGVQLVELAGSGTFTAAALSESIKPLAYYHPNPRLVCLENTHNKSGGRVFAQDDILEIRDVAKERGLKIHLDGARLWNAAVATGLSEAELAAPADTVSVCFSKGLGAPVGSALVFDREHRNEAMRLRRRMGGAMRQAGILAAAALFALEHQRSALADDHRRARELSEGLAVSDGIECDPKHVETNIVVFDVDDAPSLVQRSQGEGVLLTAIGPRRIRAVTHRDVDDASIARALDVLRRLC